MYTENTIQITLESSTFKFNSTIFYIIKDRRIFRNHNVVCLTYTHIIINEKWKVVSLKNAFTKRSRDKKISI